MENEKKHLKKAKTWNMVLLVLGILSTVSGIIGLKNVLAPDESQFEALGSYGQEMLNYMNSPLTKIVSIVTLAIGIFLVFLYIKANKLLKAEKPAPKYPYYLYLVVTVLSLCFSMITQPKPQSDNGTSLATSIVPIVIQFIIALPAILVIVHLFKAEPEEQTNE